MNNKNQDIQEIDLLVLLKGIKNFIENIKTSIFRSIRFCIKNAVVILVLIISGFGIGKYLDSKKGTFTNQMIVIPNFESVDYLYSKVDYLNSKIKQNDLIYLKDVVGIEKPENLQSINVKAIKDMFKLLDEESKKVTYKEKLQNLDLIRLMVEEGSMKKVLTDSMTNKNYVYHKISIINKEYADRKALYEPIINYLNSSEYYKKYNQIYLDNVQKNISTKEKIIGQIDAIVDQFSKDSGKNLSNSLVYNNENLGLNEIIKTKDSINKELGDLKLKVHNSKKIINDVSYDLNMVTENSRLRSWSQMLPLLLVFMFIGFKVLIDFYRRQLQLEKQRENA